jgi:pimeloyl-ACP methyl ester carboxylesterase
VITRRFPSIIASLIVLGAAIPAYSAIPCEPDAYQASGAVYRICMPDRWNGNLVLFAHGYVAANEPVAIPEDQLVLPDGTSIPGLINALGFAFATTSYATNGLALPQALDDLVDLVGIFNGTHPPARRVYIVGPSEGGLVTTLAVERFPNVFAGGVAACGPIGSFRQQVNYNGDFSVVFDHFFPGVIPGDPIDVPPANMANFEDVIVPRIQEAIRADPDALRQVLSVTRAPVDANDPSTVEKTIHDLAWYSVFTSNDATEKFGGHPYSNIGRLYSGADNNLLLNLTIERFSADQNALVALQHNYETTGRLARPLVTMHTTGDQIVPDWHEQIYGLKTLLTGSARQHLNLRIDRYGHCNFQAPEVLAGFALMLFMSNSTAQDVSSLELALPPARRATYESLLRENLQAR